MALPINIEDLLNKRRIESNRIEFKKGWNPAKIYQTICAFANDFDNIGGGYILVGVEEENGIAKRPVQGLAEGELDSIQKAIIGYDNKIKPYYCARTSVEEVDGKSILVLWVPSGLERPYEVMEDVTAKRDARSRYYVRRGTSTIEAKGEVLDELREMANRTPFDDR
ncbi:MAG: AlbA family DNA-binding domain-containing protein, partial [Tannerella sp.]|uniref:AlbA family DNA-binding domain-containing protein n=1 Tax=Tannerella sp. TaxID=2382127 RepID=UPI003FA23F5F